MKRAKTILWLLMLAALWALVGLLVWSAYGGLREGEPDRSLPLSEWPGEDFPFVSSLPVLYFSVEDLDKLCPDWSWSPDGPLMPPREETKADLYVFDREENRLTDNPTQLFQRASLCLRGRTSSYMQEKKPFLLELRDEYNNPADLSLLSFAPDSDYVLHAPYIDRSLIRNYLAYTLGAQVLEYSPDCAFVEVFVNQAGQPVTQAAYAGVYLAVEKIKASPCRVDVGEYRVAPELGRQFEDGGGFIFKRDTYTEGYDDALRLGLTERGREYSLVKPKADEVSQAQVDRLEQELQFFEDILYEGSDQELEKYFDTDSFVNFLLLNEFLKNMEGFSSSTYFYREEGGKLKAGPPWDFDIAMGNSDYLGNLSNADGFFVLTGEYAAPYLEHPAFVQKLKDRWKELRGEGGAFSEENIDALIDSLNQFLEEPARRNDAAYPELWSETIFGNAEGYVIENSEEDRKMIREFLRRRGSWLDENIDLL